MKMENRIHAYRGALDRLDRWIQGHRRPDGSWVQPASPSGYFSLPPYACEVGRRDWAITTVRHVEESFVGADRTLQQGARDQMLPYVPSWLAWGASLTERFRFASSLIDQVLAFRSPSDGFFGSEEGRRTGRGPIDFDSTTMATVALALCGRVEDCRRSADFLLRLYGDQPEIAASFCTAWSEPGGLGFVEDEFPSTAILRWAEPSQHYYKIGLFTLALAYAYGATGDGRYLDCGVELYDRAVESAADLWTNTLSHKMCWAGTLLHSVTGRAQYLEHACRFADHLVSLQQEDGAFNYPELWPSYPPTPWEMIPNAGLQFGLWIARTLSRLRSATG